MPDARLQRTRDAYRCPSCDGDGRVSDCYDGGEYACSDCGGEGIRLLPLPPAEPLRPLTPVEDALMRATFAVLRDRLQLTGLINRKYE